MNTYHQQFDSSFQHHHDHHNHHYAPHDPNPAVDFLSQDPPDYATINMPDYPALQGRGKQPNPCDESAGSILFIVVLLFLAFWGGYAVTSKG
jgi:hypothetical protein